jgi:hypothetical protein
VNQVYDGRCLCGAVSFRAEGAPKWVLWCHCNSCRRHSGAPASVFVSFADVQVTMLAGEIAKYESSPGVERGFCAKCGSTMTCSNPKLPNETHFHIGVFERAGELVPSAELFGNEKMPWFAQRTGPFSHAAALATIALGRAKKPSPTSKQSSD